MEAKHLWFGQLALMALSFLFQIIAMAPSDAMWSSSSDVLDINGCGLFGCDGNIPCACHMTGCTTCPVSIAGCSDTFGDIACEDLAGHMLAAQAFSILTIMIMIPALILCALRVTPFHEKVPKVFNIQCLHICTAVLCLITFALVAASYDRDLCGCAVKDKYDSGLSYGFAFLVINFVFQIICAILAGASQAMEGAASGDYATYSA
ncbi:hypothetical protein DIPPA_05396 [Diplonema papillatum]|nr:hypothetical protein DIPPA_05396 [Diplonema papillatum]